MLRVEVPGLVIDIIYLRWAVGWKTPRIARKKKNSKASLENNHRKAANREGKPLFLYVHRMPLDCDKNAVKINGCIGKKK